MSVAPDSKPLREGPLPRALEASHRLIRAAHDGVVPPIKRTTIRVRSRHLFVSDVLGMTVAALLALAVWLGDASDAGQFDAYLWVLGIVVAAQAALNVALGIYGYSWRYASVADMGRLILCAFMATTASWAIVTIEAAWAPMAVVTPGVAFWFLVFSFAIGVLATPRFIIRLASDLRTLDDRAPAVEAKRTLLYGAGWAGVMVARSAQRGPDASIVPVGFLDGDPELAGRRMAGLRVFGDLHVLGRAIRRTKATALLITMPSASGDAVRRVAESAMAHGLEVRTVPPMTDLLDGSLDTTRIRSLRVEDLLRRQPAREHTPMVAEVFTDRVVVITGAAGSIGSELARQVTAVGPRRIVLVDQAESPLYLIEREILDRVAEHRRTSGDSAEVVSHLADVADREAMARLFERVRPDVVLHAAAYKHVPMLEDHPSKAVSVNIGGTASVLDAAAAAGVERFVLVSTDKAVWPSSVMGASKRVAEMLVAEAGQRLGRAWVSVRFGNVLGSNGSVVPVFQEQLEKGRPLTVTHPEMTRYFMTIPEAAWLILDAAAIARRPGLFVLDMGEPVRILDIARDLIRLAGRDPESVPIEFVGLRRGEKLHEELFYDQELVEPTEVPKVMRSEAPRPPDAVRDDIGRLLALADGQHETELQNTLHAYVRAWIPEEEQVVDDPVAAAAPERAAPAKALVGIPIEALAAESGEPGMTREAASAAPKVDPRAGVAAAGQGRDPRLRARIPSRSAQGATNGRSPVEEHLAGAASEEQRSS